MTDFEDLTEAEAIETFRAMSECDAKVEFGIKFGDGWLFGSSDGIWVAAMVGDEFLPFADALMGNPCVDHSLDRGEPITEMMH